MGWRAEGVRHACVCEAGSLIAVLSVQNRRNRAPLLLHAKVLPDTFLLHEGLVLGQNGAHKRAKQSLVKKII